ncbi:hypothetical protein H7I00_19950 [Mycobacterium bohemicum]|nr:hypothetical protein [Mycobacterium bohemicum]MCV6971832.1 hypothetical protein [Mycobacterium bohemicum]
MISVGIDRPFSFALQGSQDAFSQMGAGFKAMFGGELAGMTKNLAEKYTASQLGYGAPPPQQ